MHVVAVELLEDGAGGSVLRLGIEVSLPGVPAQRPRSGLQVPLGHQARERQLPPGPYPPPPCGCPDASCLPPSWCSRRPAIGSMCCPKRSRRAPAWSRASRMSRAGGGRGAWWQCGAARWGGSKPEFCMHARPCGACLDLHAQFHTLQTCTCACLRRSAKLLRSGWDTRAGSLRRRVPLPAAAARQG